MAPIRWGSIQAMAETNRVSSTLSLPLALWISLKRTSTILKQIDSAITSYESDSGQVSKVYATFANKLPTAIMKMVTITQEECAYMLKLNQNRFDFMYGDAKGIEYLLDPRYVSEGMFIELRNKIKNIIHLHPPCCRRAVHYVFKRAYVKGVYRFPHRSP
jgi:hypothetical protein